MEKKPWQSKTQWASLIVAVVGFIPPVADWVSQNPEAFGLVLSVLFGGLRLITNSKIVIR